MTIICESQKLQKADWVHINCSKLQKPYFISCRFIVLQISCPTLAWLLHIIKAAKEQYPRLPVSQIIMRILSIMWWIFACVTHIMAKRTSMWCKFVGQMSQLSSDFRICANTDCRHIALSQNTSLTYRYHKQGLRLQLNWNETAWSNLIACFVPV